MPRARAKRVARPRRKVFEEAWNTLSRREVAEYFNVNVDVTTRWAKYYRLVPKRRASPQTTAAQRADRATVLVALYNSGVYTLGELGELFHITRERVRQILAKSGERTLYGINGTRIDILAICRAVERCGSLVEVVRQTGHSHGAVRKALTEIGRWEAVQQAWDERVLTHRKHYLLTHLKSLAEMIGYTPSTHDINHHGPPYHAEYFHTFGRLRHAQELAGLRPNTVGGYLQRKHGIARGRATAETKRG